MTTNLFSPHSYVEVFRSGIRDLASLICFPFAAPRIHQPAYKSMHQLFILAMYLFYDWTIAVLTLSFVRYANGDVCLSYLSLTAFFQI